MFRMLIYIAIKLNFSPHFACQKSNHTFEGVKNQESFFFKTVIFCDQISKGEFSPTRSMHLEDTDPILTFFLLSITCLQSIELLPLIIINPIIKPSL